MFGIRCLEFVDHRIGIVATLASQLHGSKSGYGHVSLIIDNGKAHHVLSRLIRLEAGFLANPLGTLLGNGLLGKFVAELDFKLRTI